MCKMWRLVSDCVLKPKMLISAWEPKSSKLSPKERTTATAPVSISLGVPQKLTSEPWSGPGDVACQSGPLRTGDITDSSGWLSETLR